MSHKQKLPECTNCGFIFEGVDNFCPNCGQENHDIKLPIRHHIHEVIEGLLHFDSKSMKTFFYLVAKPGLLSKEFNSGKRIRFVPPVRLYIFISFVFFLLLSTGKIIHKETSGKEGDKFAITFFSSSMDDRVTSEEKAVLTKKQIDSLQVYRSQVAPREIMGMNNSQIDSVMTDKRIDKNMVNRYIFRQMAKAGSAGSANLLKMMQKNMSYGMFLLMPLMGMFFYLFYRKQGGFYVENLVISIHYHCVIFIIFSFVLLADKFTDFGAGYFIAFFLVPVYLYFMLKKYFGQRAGVTFVKTLSLGLIHIITTVLFYLVSTLLTIILL